MKKRKYLRLNNLEIKILKEIRIINQVATQGKNKAPKISMSK